MWTALAGAERKPIFGEAKSKNGHWAGTAAPGPAEGRGNPADLPALKEAGLMALNLLSWGGKR